MGNKGGNALNQGMNEGNEGNRNTNIDFRVSRGRDTCSQNTTEPPQRESGKYENSVQGFL